MLPNDIVEYILSFLPWYEYFDVIPNINIKLFFKRYKQKYELNICFICSQTKEYVILIDYLCIVRRQSKKHLMRAIALCALNGHYDTFLLLRDKFGTNVNNHAYDNAIYGAINGHNKILSLFNNCYSCRNNWVFNDVVISGNVSLSKKINFGEMCRYVFPQNFNKLLNERKYEMLIHLYEINLVKKEYFLIDALISGLCKDGKHRLLKYIYKQNIFNAKEELDVRMYTWVSIAEMNNQYHLIKYDDDDNVDRILDLD